MEEMMGFSQQYLTPSLKQWGLWWMSLKLIRSSLLSALSVVCATVYPVDLSINPHFQSVKLSNFLLFHVCSTSLGSGTYCSAYHDQYVGYKTHIELHKSTLMDSQWSSPVAYGKRSKLLCIAKWFVGKPVLHTTPKPLIFNVLTV